MGHGPLAGCGVLEITGSEHPGPRTVLAMAQRAGVLIEGNRPGDLGPSRRGSSPAPAPASRP
ncbi:MAG TPA: hypothetical protein VJT49_01960 [Amycolatopsis sp.]|uniref:hypothetical protein n=1 Tax=Amycolatopsis sp. TaxID=37632 RepID=UPI002B46CECE|nr:hypothetical protein [Amycolatopsis sp.]HKS43878.1 hypothetical protein [Amycolatopsis sp.]